MTLLFCFPDSYAFKAELTMGRLDMREIKGAVDAEEGIELAMSPKASAASCSAGSGLEEEEDDRGRSSNSSNSSDELL